MSVSGISNTNLYQTDSAKTNFQQIRDYFQQLGQALQSGDLNASPTSICGTAAIDTQFIGW